MVSCRERRNGTSTGMLPNVRKHKMSSGSSQSGTHARLLQGLMVLVVQTSTEDANSKVSDRHEVELVPIWSFMIILMNCPCLMASTAHPIYIQMHCRRVSLGHQAVIVSRTRVISINLVTRSPAFLTDPRKHPSWHFSASSPDQPLSSSASPTHSPQPCHP